MSAGGPAIDRERLRAVLCDADGNLFPSEEHAFVPSTAILNEFLAERGQPDRHRPEDMRRATSGMNFRSTISRVAAARGLQLGEEELERLVDREREAVTAHLARMLEPDGNVLAAVERLAKRYELAAVSSSAAARLTACFVATGLAGWFPARIRFSAEDSLPTPRSKPDPAIYLHALAALGLEAEQAVAIEDAAPGVQSAVAAGIPAIGNLVFVPARERRARAAELLAAGAAAIAGSWAEVADLLEPAGAIEDPAPAQAADHVLGEVA